MLDVNTLILMLPFTDISDLFDVHYELMNVAHNWRGVGKALRLHPDLLKRIEEDSPDSMRRLEEALTEWLKKSYDTDRFGPPSWKLLVSAVAHPAGGNDRALAEQIAKNHNGKSSHLQLPITLSFHLSI